MFDFFSAAYRVRADLCGWWLWKKGLGLFTWDEDDVFWDGNDSVILIIPVVVCDSR